MADPWRSRYLAPVYALIIAFAVVALLGLAIREKPGTQISLVASTGDLKALKDAPVKVYVDVGGPVPGSLDNKGNVTVRLPDKPFTVCAVLPNGWSVPGAIGPIAGLGTCWGPFNPPIGELKLNVTGPK